MSCLLPYPFKAHSAHAKKLLETADEAITKQQPPGPRGDEHDVGNAAACLDPPTQLFHDQRTRPRVPQQCGCIYKPEVMSRAYYPMMFKCGSGIYGFPKLSGHRIVV